MEASGTNRADIEAEAARRASETAKAADITTGEAVELVSWLRNRWPELAARNGLDPEYLVPGNVVSYGPKSLHENRRAKAALAVLADTGFLTRMRKRTAINGTARNVAYRIEDDAPKAKIAEMKAAGEKTAGPSLTDRLEQIAEEERTPDPVKDAGRLLALLAEQRF